MIFQVVNSTKSLTGKLALFFTLISFVMVVISFLIFFHMMTRVEDEVGHKRIILDSEVAISRYKSGEEGKLKIDFLTDSYNDFSLVSKKYLPYFDGKTSFFGKLEEEDDEDSALMAYITQYESNGVMKPIIMLSRIDAIELRPYELVIPIALELGKFALLLTIFTLTLMRLSKSLISPINNLSEQLNNNKGDTSTPFVINDDAAVEFTQLTHQLNHYRAEINSLIKREQIFARYASHELRTPLTIIRGANDLLQRGEHSDFQTRQLERIKGASNQMTTMVDALLGLVRYERNYSETPLRKIQEDELQSIINDHYSHIWNKNISIELDISGEPEIRATSAIINMIVGNLIRNAISATDNGKIEVLMNATSITVLDEGVGLIEQPFEEGHGLGVLLVEDLCNRYGWRFTLSNRPEHGCIAKILFS